MVVLGGKKNMMQSSYDTETRSGISSYRLSRHVANDRSGGRAGFSSLDGEEFKQLEGTKGKRGEGTKGMMSG
jgi:hypothetical protein